MKSFRRHEQTLMLALGLAIQKSPPLDALDLSPTPHDFSPILPDLGPHIRSPLACSSGSTKATSTQLSCKQLSTDFHQEFSWPPDPMQQVASFTEGSLFEQSPQNLPAPHPYVFEPEFMGNMSTVLDAPYLGHTLLTRL